MTSDRVFIYADWRNVEGRLTALFSGDPVLRSELAAELTGGPKVHALNAALIYGIEPADAYSHMVNLKGRMVPAYDGGKRTTHAFNYGMGYRQGARTFWLPEADIKAKFDLLGAKYAIVKGWREALGDVVFGVVRFVCPRCGFETSAVGDCPGCSAAVGVAIPLRFSGYSQAPERISRTAFERIRRYLGRRREGANALAAQHPQSAGASMWNVTFVRLHGWDPIADAAWPTPPGTLTYHPEAPWSALFKPAPIFVATGTYDSFAIEAPASRAIEVAHWTLWTMEQAWPALDGWKFPAEGFIGSNMGKWNATSNPNGLKEIEHVPFTRTREATWSAQSGGNSLLVLGV